MARTQTDLIDAVLHKLGILDAVETASGTDFVYIRNEYQDKLEELRDDGLAYWTANEIPNVVFTTLVKMMANEVSMPFGFPGTVADMVLAEDVLRKQLRRHMSKPASGEPTQAVSY